MDGRVVAKLRRRYPLDSEFLEFMALHHGGIPKICEFEVASSRLQIGQFLTLLDKESILTPPRRPHFDRCDMDERVVNGIYYLMEYDHSTSRALFRDLVPFAALDTEMRLDDAYVDLLCLDYRNRRIAPAVILWVAGNANSTYMDWDDLPSKDRFDESGNNINSLSVPWNDFVIPVADDFSAFVKMIQPVA